MELKSEPEAKRSKQPLNNGADFDILRKDEAFWQNTVMNLAKENISEARGKVSENDGSSLVEHHEREFCIHCDCCKCLIYRKLLIGIHVENEAYNDLWDKLKEIICSYYTMLPTETDSTIKRKYQELQAESCGIRWVSDGSIDVKKNIHVSMGNYFSLSNEMTFIIVFNMLYTRDRHQLFELLFLQLTSIILAYREGIKEMTRCVDGDEESYSPKEFLQYILNGYDRLTTIGVELTPLVIEMRDHLQIFSLTWQLMNQCMYYRFLYVDIESRMADCILRLKDAVDAETYKNFVYRFIKFDEEMTQMGQIWEVAQVALELYRKTTPEQVSRIERIAMIRQISESLGKLSDFPADVKITDHALALDWIVSSENNDVWYGILNTIKNEPHYKNNKKPHCKCWACLLCNGITVPDISVISDDPHVDAQKKEPNEPYHLSWAVFKNLKDRQPYTEKLIHPEQFCVFTDPSCHRMECQVATNLIIGSYPLSFTKFLLRTYQPLSLSDREKFLKVPSQSLIRKFCLKKGGAAAKEIMQEADEINHSFLLLNMFWDDEDIADPLLRAGLAAALAENFKIEVKFPQKHIIFSYFYALFRTVPSPDDIIMDLEWLEKINLANLFKSFGAISNTIHEPANVPNTVESIEMSLNELKITAEVSSGSSSALDLVQFSMKEVADKLSSITLTDDNTENAKKVLENEIKKPLVEALKLAASNKKLEAELKSLQKEHNMLKDMVKGLEQIHGDKKEVQVTVATTVTKPVPPESNPSRCGHHHNHSQLPASSPSTSVDADHAKDAGNGADCVCYYCTLFGKNQDLMNSRSTETRDRLRKRLHHLQTQKDFSNKTKNLKNISLLLKNGTATAAVVTNPAKAPRCTDGTKHKCPSSSPNGNATMKMKVELELQRKKKVNVPKPNAAAKPEVKIQRATEINVKSLENLVEYIEGPSSKAVVEQKKADEAVAKKLQKKTKQLEQKVRREIDARIEILKKINDELQGTIIDAKQVQNQLGQLKAGKGKNKELKKVKTAEDKLAELTSLRVKLESEVKGICADVKDLNPNFDLYRECLEMKTVVSLLTPPPVTCKPPPPVVVQQPAPRAPVKIQQSQPIQQQPQLQKPPTDDDPSKRMVTIRRINLPHAEPQVTVTAKGSSGDLDQLLYTFVNGQLVPASSLSPSAFQNGSIQLFMSSNGHTKMVVDNQREQTQQNGQPASSASQKPSSEKCKQKQEKVAIEKPKKKSDKKKEELVTVDIKKAAKKEPTRKPEDNSTHSKPQTVVEKKKKVKKAYIDPQFAANPFKLLDDEQHSESDGEYSDGSSEPEEPIKRLEEDLKNLNLKKVKEDKKAIKKQQQVQATKTGKTAVKKTAVVVSKATNVERKDSVASVTSVTSSNTSKDSKKSKNQSNLTVDNAFKPIDFGRLSSMYSQQPQANSNSIMDQLNRGVRVEGLRLPPGITLTKVASSDAVGSKKESINQITKPMQDYPTAPSRVTVDNPMTMKESNGIIMVESNPHKSKLATDTAASKKKNKKKRSKSDSMENALKTATANQQQPPTGTDRMVTLKNPMFFNNPAEPMNSMMRNLQPTPPLVPTPDPTQSASIIRNENGMYTIRNPTFQNAFGANTTPTTFTPRPQVEPIRRPFASQFSSFESDSMANKPKCNSVIGSEMKNVLQRRKEQELAANIDPYHQYGMQPSSSYSHFGGPGMNFNNNGIQCDDGFMSQPMSTGFQQYPSSLMSNYNDLRLQPGQMLNSEVTIHNVTESKVFQANKTPPPIGTPRNGNIEIIGPLFNTRRSPRSTEMMNGIDDDCDSFKRFELNNDVPAKRKIDELLANSKQASHAMGCDFDKRQSSANSVNDSPVSATSLDEIFESSNSKNDNHHHKSGFYSSSGASSLF